MIIQPKECQFLEHEQGPPIIIESLKLYGIEEFEGSENNPTIMDWAKELGIDWYTADSIPWCGLDAGIVARRAGYPFDPALLLKALNWLKYGISLPLRKASLGDFLVFNRPAAGKEAGHVGVYAAEDESTYYVLGGNENNRHGIVRMLKQRLVGVQRPPYKEEILNIRKIYISSKGEISSNEK